VAVVVAVVSVVKVVPVVVAVTVLEQKSVLPFLTDDFDNSHSIRGHSLQQEASTVPNAIRGSLLLSWSGSSNGSETVIGLACCSFKDINKSKRNRGRSQENSS
jgi:hypothetical protein